MLGSLGHQSRKDLYRHFKKTLEIVQQLQQGKSQRLVADEFEVAKSIVCDIWKDQQKIEECIASNEAGIAETN